MNVSLVYNDFRKTDFPNLFDNLTSSFARQIGVVLQHQRKKPGGIHFTYNTKKSHDDSYTKHYVSPVYPDDEVPPMIEFLNQSEHPEHDESRFKFLKWIINDETLQDIDLSTIPKKYLLDVLVLTYMVRQGFLSTVEADLILYTVQQVENNEIPIDITAPEIVTDRAFRIPFLFTCFYKVYEHSLQAVGLFDSMAVIHSHHI